MACNLTRTNARICTQDRITLDTSISGNRSDWRAALQKRVWGHKAGSTGVSSEPWKPRGQNASWSASNTAWPAEGKSWLSHCTHCWCSLATSRPSEPHSLKRMWWSFFVSKGGDKQPVKGLEEMSSEEQRGTLSLSSLQKRRLSTFLSTVFRDRDIISPRYPVIGLVWVAQSCTTGRFRLVIRKRFFIKRVKDWNRLLREVISAPGTFGQCS